MDTPPNPPARSIVVGADDSEGSDRAVTWAAREAAATAATLRIVSVWSVPALLWPAAAGYAYIDPADLRVGAVAILDRARALAINAARGSTLPVEITDVQGGVAEQLLAQAAGADLLVVGTRGHGGFARLVLGSVATTCAHHTTVPLAVINADAAPADAGEIIVGVDDSPGGRSALRWAAAEAGRVGAVLRVVHGWEIPVAPGDETLAMGWDPDLEKAAQEGLERLVAEELDGTSPRPVIEVSAVLLSASEALISESESASLLVVGSRGRGGFRGLLLGSVSQHCLHHSACPLVIVPIDVPVDAPVAGQPSTTDTSS